MKYILTLIGIVSLGMVGQEGTLSVKINGLSNVKGQLMIAIYDSSCNFPKHDAAFKQLKINAKASNFSVTLPVKRKYAIAVYHDQNLNQKMDKNFFGVPVEKYGFSNQARGIFGPPSFDEAAFYFSKSTVVSIWLE